MEPVSFADASWQVVAVGGGGRQVVASTLLSAPDARVLVAALHWQRAQDHLAPAMETAAEILALRALVALTDELETVADSSLGGPVMLTSAQVALLTEAATRYVAARDIESHQPPRERERIARLHVLKGPLFDLVGRFREAEEEARTGGRLG